LSKTFSRDLARANWTGGWRVEKMAETDKSDCDYKVYLEKKISQRRELVLISYFLRLKKNENGISEKKISPLKNCHIEGKNSLYEREFQIVIDHNTLNIPYGAIKEIWEDVSGKINLELRLIVIFDEDAIREDERLRLMPPTMQI
jgi:hypothetical protein